MKIIIDEQGHSRVAIIESDGIILRDVQDALDLMATVQYNHDGVSKLLLHESAIAGEFFDLKTKLAGEILQKYVNYRVKLAIVGDFEKYTSKSLKDFIYECNHGKQVWFLSSREDALNALHAC